MAQKRMTERQHRFAEAYWAPKDARQAAEQAGYPPGFGERLLQVASVRSFLDQKAEDERRTAVASADEVLQYLTRVLRADSGQSSMKAAELLGKRLGLFSEQAESLPKPVIVDDLRRMPDGERTGARRTRSIPWRKRIPARRSAARMRRRWRRGRRCSSLPAEARRECSAVGDAACEAAQPPPAGAQRECSVAAGRMRPDDRAAVGADRAGVPRGAPRPSERRPPRILAARRARVGQVELCIAGDRAGAAARPHGQRRDLPQGRRDPARERVRADALGHRAAGAGRALPAQASRRWNWNTCRRGSACCSAERTTRENRSRSSSRAGGLPTSGSRSWPNFPGWTTSAPSAPASCAARAGRRCSTPTIRRSLRRTGSTKRRWPSGRTGWCTKAPT